MPKDTRWDRNLSVAPDGEGLIGHAGAVLLRKLADQCGLTACFVAGAGPGREVPADRPRDGAGIDGGRDRAGRGEHERYRAAGPGITQTIAATRAPPESLRLTPGFP